MIGPRSRASARWGAVLGVAFPSAAAPVGSATTYGSFRFHVQESEVSDRPANRLANETSPYLLQHAHNPVDWYPWGEEAFQRARAENKPIFLSIGYSACHWCHVMEHECFEDEAIAARMNELFVCIKVDREERPDVDDLYMKAVQALTGGGGWPMSVWLFPDGRPFYGGTYFPPEDRFGRPGFPTVCERLSTWYHDQGEAAEQQATALTEHIRRAVAPIGEPADTTPAVSVVPNALRQILATFDDRYGGFGGAPKFPHPMDLALLLRADPLESGSTARRCVEHTLDRMARGGIYDQLGGGFHRYSVDAQWLVPHFEKMLYDNALLAEIYLDGYLRLGRADFRETCEDVLAYVQREMTAPNGAFYSSQDADSEGEEGRFFVWDRAEIADALGEENGDWVAEYYGVEPGGNFEHGKSVLWRPHTRDEFAQERSLDPDQLRADLIRIRKQLFDAREARVRPGRDEKVLVDWNGLMITAFARAGFHLERSDYVEAARRAASHLLEHHRTEDGRLLRTAKNGEARLVANLGDYAAFVRGLLALYQASAEARWLRAAIDLTEVTRRHFADSEEGGFYFTADDAEALLARSKEAYDGATPSAPSMQVENLLQLFELTGDPSYRIDAERTLRLYAPLLEEHSRAVSLMVQNVWFLHSDACEIVLVGPDRASLEPFLDVLRQQLLPPRSLHLVWPDGATGLEELAPVVGGKTTQDGKPAAYVCRDFVCEQPVLYAGRFATLLSDH